MLFRAAEYKGTHDVHPCGNPINHSAKLADTTRSLCRSDGDVFSENSGSKRRHDGNSHLFLRVRISGAKCVAGKQRIVPYTRNVGSLPGCTTELCLGVAKVSAKETCFKCMFRGSNFSISGPLAVVSGTGCHCNYHRQARELSSPAMLFLPGRCCAAGAFLQLPPGGSCRNPWRCHSRAPCREGSQGGCSRPR